MPVSLKAGLVVVAVVLVVGPVGYLVLTDLHVWDAIYMTVITITTVGFSEIGGPYGTGARLWTLGIITIGTGAALYTAYAGLEYGVERLVQGRRERRRMVQAIESMDGHVILCGFGRVGVTAWETLRHANADVVVIDDDAERVGFAIEREAVAILGDATSDDVLRRAGIQRASTVISAVASDSDNLVIALSAKSLNPDVRVVARAIGEDIEKKLYLAGADRVVAPQSLGGQRLASLALKPDVTEFVDLVVSGRTVEFGVESFTIDEDAPIVGKTLADLDLHHTGGALVIAVGEDPTRVRLNPPSDMVFRPGEIVIALGSSEQLDAFRKLAVGG